MKLLLSWLNEYGDFGDPSDPAAVQRVTDALTSLGLEVDSVSAVGASVAGVVTARVIRLEQHPDAAKVQRVYVDAGDGAERHVWCGAFNMQPGDVVPLATLGTTMPDGRTIERRGILGIDSDGMLCSATELGLGDDHSGIYVLPGDTPLGVPYGDALGLTPDVLIDADVTRNRPDCWGYLGVARDLAAKLGTEFRPPTPDLIVAGPERTAPVEIIERPRMRTVHLDGDLRRRGGPIGRLDGSAPDGGRHATDQQRRRRQQLRHARDESAEPRVRPRHPRRRRIPRAPGTRRGAADHARRAGQNVHRRPTC